jgi:protein-tyrosine phosphatase
MSRSVSVIIAFLMKEHGWTLEQALGHVKQVHPPGESVISFINVIDPTLDS